MRKIKLFESFKSHQELTKITDKILKKFAEEIDISFLEYQISDYNLRTKDVIDIFKEEKEIGKFIDSEFEIFISLKNKYSHLPLSKRYTKANFVEKYENCFIINIYANSLHEVLVNAYHNSYNFRDSVYLTLHDSIRHALIHELQHLRDHLVSDGLFNHKKKTSLFYNTSEEDRKNDKEFKLAKDYMNLDFEMSAFFTATINEISFKDLDIDDDGFHFKMAPLKSVISEFKFKYPNWILINDKNKKKLIRKVSQYWHKEKELLDKEKKEFIDKNKGEL